NFPAIYQWLRSKQGTNHAPFPCCKAVPTAPQRFQRLTTSPDSSVQHACYMGWGGCSAGVRGLWTCLLGQFPVGWVQPDRAIVARMPVYEFAHDRILPLRKTTF